MGKRRACFGLGLCLAAAFAAVAPLTAARGRGASHGGPRVVLVHSTGHVGTTTLSHALKGLGLPGVLVDFEAWPIDAWAMPLQPRHKAGRVSGPPPPYRTCDDAARLATRYVQWVQGRIKDHNASVYVHVGHDVSSAGVSQPLARQLGAERLALVRLTRGRADTALSFLVEDLGRLGRAHHDRRQTRTHGPCGFLEFARCPYRLSECLESPVGRKDWSRLTLTQKYLWSIDESECDWLAARDALQGIKTRDVSWSTDFTPAMVRDAAEAVLSLAPGPAEAAALRAALDAGIALLEKRHVPHTKAHLADAKVVRMPQKLRDALRSERTLEAFVAHEDEGYRAKLKACPACARCAARAEEARTSRQSEGARRGKHQASRGGGSEAGGSGGA